MAPTSVVAITLYAYVFFINLQVVLTVRDPKGWYRSVTESFQKCGLEFCCCYISTRMLMFFFYKSAGGFDSAGPEGLVQVCDRVLL